jgi:hypothetical protein
MNLKEAGSESVEWIFVVQDTNLWWALMKLRLRKSWENSWQDEWLLASEGLCDLMLIKTINPVLFQRLECVYVSVNSSPDSINNICII